MPRNSLRKAPAGAVIVESPAAAGRTMTLEARSSSETLKRPATKAPEEAVVFDHGRIKLPPEVSSSPRQSGAPEKPDHAHVGDAPPTVAHMTPAPYPTWQKKM
jgi:hypothetical protein